MPSIFPVCANFTVTVAGGDVDLLSLQPADDRPCKIRGYRLSQGTNIGDAQEQVVRITGRRLLATLTVGSGGSVITATTPNNDSAAPAWGFVARANDTTVATTSGLNDIKLDFYWNTRNTPLDDWYPDDDFAIKVRQGEGFVLRCETTVIANLALSLVVWVQQE